MKTLRDQRILITGASSGIGRALSVRLAREGARLIVSARNETELALTALACREAGGSAQVIAADVTREDDCRHLVEGAVAAYGGLDALVNNAGLTMLARFDETTDLGAYERLMRVNFLSAVYCTHAALPHLKASRGQVVAVSSLSGLVGVPTRSAYAASKHALQGFCDALRVELQPNGVSVLVVSPGFVQTDMRKNALGSDGRVLGADPRPKGGGMTVERCADLIASAMAHRQRELVMTFAGKAARFMNLLWPGLVDRRAARAVKPEAGLHRKG